MENLFLHSVISAVGNTFPRHRSQNIINQNDNVSSHSIADHGKGLAACNEDSTMKIGFQPAIGPDFNISDLEVLSCIQFSQKSNKYFLY